MKKILFAISIAAIFLASCQQDDHTAATDKIAPEFALSIDGDTRAAYNYPIDDYFGLGEGFQNISITADAATTYTYTYTYSPTTKRFYASDSQNALYFPNDGSVLDRLTFIWPSEEFINMHLDGYGGFRMLKDQSTKEAFLSMDWLAGEVMNVKPTLLVPVTMYHMFNSKITIELTGDHKNKRIESLSIGGFKAYCDPKLKSAQLMYGSDDMGSLRKGSTGVVKIEGVDEPIEFLIIDSPDDHITGGGQNYTISLNI